MIEEAPGTPTPADRSPDYEKAGYFAAARREITPLLPIGCERVLELGCGRGGTLRYLREAGLCKWTCGIELAREPALVAASHVDQMIVGDVESMDIPVEDQSIDCILCLDVLEHLRDPWAVIARFHRLLRIDGVLIASIPNVNNFRVTFPLLFRGQWNYAETGLLDRTHLRFFVRDSAVDLLQSSGLKVDGEIQLGITPKSLKWWIDSSTFGLLRRFLIFQYILRARRMS